MQGYAQKLCEHKTKVAFFSSTPQGGGVALMRHALVRFSRLMKVDLTWYVPKPKPGFFRITKEMHNTLQGLNDPYKFVSEEEKRIVTDWIGENAERYWFSKGGPLCAPEEGGANVIIIDDPQMSGLVSLIKKRMPNRPVLYRSHIQVRKELIAQEGSPQADVWNYLWSNIKQADMFISHPIYESVPDNVPKAKVAYLPATTDWLDGLNKPLNKWNSGYYGHVFNQACHALGTAELIYPERKYIAQVARFDRAKGIAVVIDAYAKFCRMCEGKDYRDVPQLVVCGNCSVDNPDNGRMYERISAHIRQTCPDLARDISVARLDPTDQMLNTIISKAHVVLQLSTEEGFEVKVSEALHAGRPVIVSNVGGIPLQVKPNINSFVVAPGDSEAVAKHLWDLCTDAELHRKMSLEAGKGVSDEVGTVGNALSWYYLASKWAEDGASMEPNGRWVNDMAREEAQCPYVEGENRLHVPGELGGQ